MVHGRRVGDWVVSSVAGIPRGLQWFSYCEEEEFRPAGVSWSRCIQKHELIRAIILELASDYRQ